MARLRVEPNSTALPHIAHDKGGDDEEVAALRNVLTGECFDKYLQLYRNLWHKYADRDGITSKLHEHLDASSADNGSVPTSILACIVEAHLAGVADPKVGIHARALAHAPWSLDLLTLWAVFGGVPNKTKWPSSRMLAGLRDYADADPDFRHAMQRLDAARWFRLDCLQDALLKRQGRQRSILKDWELKDIRHALQSWVDENPSTRTISMVPNRRKDQVSPKSLPVLRATKMTKAGKHGDETPLCAQPHRREGAGNDHDRDTELRQRPKEQAEGGRGGSQDYDEEVEEEGEEEHEQDKARKTVRSDARLPGQDKARRQRPEEQEAGDSEATRNHEEEENQDVGGTGSGRPGQGDGPPQRPKDDIDEHQDFGLELTEQDVDDDDDGDGEQLPEQDDDGHALIGGAGAEPRAQNGDRHPSACVSEFGDKSDRWPGEDGDDDDGYQSADVSSLELPWQGNGHQQVGGSGREGEAQWPDPADQCECDGSQSTSRELTGPFSRVSGGFTTSISIEKGRGAVPDLDLSTTAHLIFAEQFRRETFETTFLETSTPRQQRQQLDRTYFTPLPLPSSSSSTPTQSPLAMTTRPAPESPVSNPAKRQCTKSLTHQSPAELAPPQMQWWLDLWVASPASPTPPALQRAVDKHKNIIEAAAVGTDSALYIVLARDCDQEGEEQVEVEDEDEEKDRGLLVILPSEIHLWVAGSNSRLLEEQYEQIYPDIKSLLPNPEKEPTRHVRELPIPCDDASLSTRIAASIALLVSRQPSSEIEDAVPVDLLEAAEDWQRYVELAASLSTHQDATLSFFDMELDTAHSPSDSPSFVESQAALSKFYTSRFDAWTLQQTHLRTRAALSTALHNSLSGIARSAARAAAIAQHQAPPEEIVNARRRIERFREVLQESAGSEREHMERALVEMERKAAHLQAQHAGSTERDRRIGRARKALVYSLAIAKAMYEQEASQLDRTIDADRSDWIASAEAWVASAQQCLQLAKTYNSKGTPT